jgi:hypothetical protein
LKLLLEEKFIVSILAFQCYTVGNILTAVDDDANLLILKRTVIYKEIYLIKEKRSSYVQQRNHDLWHRIFFVT